MKEIKLSVNSNHGCTKSSPLAAILSVASILESLAHFRFLSTMWIIQESGFINQLCLHHLPLSQRVHLLPAGLNPRAVCPSTNWILCPCWPPMSTVCLASFISCLTLYSPSFSCPLPLLTEYYLNTSFSLQMIHNVYSLLQSPADCHHVKLQKLMQIGNLSCGN